MAEERRLKQTLRVANFSCQSRDSRYPDPYRRYAQTNQTNISTYSHHRHEDAEEPNEPPRIAHWRMNLTALSQDLNLYFAAYRDKIHCYIPRDLKQTFRARADLVIEIPRSKHAEDLGGYILPQMPHCMNHMIVGKLGDLEILLLSTDDGDVIAYYTHLIWDEINALAKGASAIPGKTIAFFHCNVHASAWGLAIHQQSRLIAVSSNRREVTIFVFGFADERSQGLVPSINFTSERNKFMDTFPLLKDVIPPPTSLTDRACNFRICINLRRNSNNIPTVAFVSDNDGEAEKVLAGDINGNMWVLEFFSSQCARLHPILHNDINSARVWAVLSIPLDNFQLAKTPHDAYGISKVAPSMNSMEDLIGGPVRKGQFFDISSCVDDVESLSAITRAPEFVPDDDEASTAASIRSSASGGLNENMPPVFVALAEHRATLEYLSSSRTRDPLARVRAIDSVRNWTPTIQSTPSFPASMVLPIQDTKSEILRMQNQENETFRRLARLPPPLRSTVAHWNDIERVYQENITSMEAETLPTTIKVVRTAEIKLNARVAFLRCYAHDIEMLSPVDISTFRTVLRRPIHRESPYLAPLLPVERMSLVALIPELNLLIVGSQNGRVCLLTLTQMEEQHSTLTPLVMFRLDLILPLKQHNFRIRPTCPLLGMAVSPLPSDETLLNFEPAIRRWRIILHYYDHTILSYDIFRVAGGDTL